jgi:hypothetical protein
MSNTSALSVNAPKSTASITNWTPKDKQLLVQFLLAHHPKYQSDNGWKQITWGPVALAVNKNGDGFGKSKTKKSCEDQWTTVHDLLLVSDVY